MSRFDFPSIEELEIDPASVAQLSHEQSIDCGDDAVNADATMAELDILARVEYVHRIDIKREFRRIWTRTGIETEVEWNVKIDVEFRPIAIGRAADLTEAVEIAIAKITSASRAA